MPSVARGSRSRFFAFCDFAYVQPRSSPWSWTNQSATMCGSPRGPFVAHCITICSSRKAEISSADISIWLRRDGKSFGGFEYGGARLLGLQHHGVAGLLED